MATFDRAISTIFENVLVEEAARAGWWQDVLHDPDLVIALRGTYLNVYWLGQSIFKVSLAGKSLTATTHKKYLIDPRLSGQVRMVGSVFQSEAFEGSVLAREYDGPDTLKRLKQSARLYSGAEKRGVHAIMKNNANTVDTEIAFSGTYPTRKSATKNPRIDIAALEADPANDGAVILAFWEAKHFENPELRAISEKDIPVCDQIELYRRCLSDNREAVETSYTKVVRTLHSLAKRRSTLGKVCPLIEAVAMGQKKLSLGETPKVGLLVYGFDQAQRDHSEWLRHSERLKRLVNHYVQAGDPKNIKLPGAKS